MVPRETSAILRLVAVSKLDEDGSRQVGSRYFEARNSRVVREAAAKEGQIFAVDGYRFERGDQSSQGIEAAAILGVSVVAGSVVQQPLARRL